MIASLNYLINCSSVICTRNSKRFLPNGEFLKRSIYEYAFIKVTEYEFE